MAIVKSAGLRNYVGKHAGNVYYLQKGISLVREKAAQVTNPKTAAQMMQRVRLANLVNFYRANKEWMLKYSFEKLRPYLSIYNEFVGANLANSVPLTKSDATAGVVLPAPLVITKGTLPSIGMLNISDTEGEALSKINVEGVGSTIAEVSQKLISQNIGWKAGDQLSAVIIGFFDGKACVVNTTEVIIDPDNTESLPDTLFVGDTTLNVNILQFSDRPGYGYGVALIHSRRENGKVLVSSETLSLSKTAIEKLEQSTTEEAYQTAADSYKVTDQPFLDPETGNQSDMYPVKKVVTPEGGGEIYGPDALGYGKWSQWRMQPNEGYQLKRYKLNDGEWITNLDQYDKQYGYTYAGPNPITITAEFETKA